MMKHPHSAVALALLGVRLGTRRPPSICACWETYRSAQQHDGLRLLQGHADRQVRPGAHRQPDPTGAPANANAVLVDNGDIIQGSPLGDYMAAKG